MNISLEKINISKKNILENLIQLYLHDLSMYFPIDFNSKIAKYEYDLDKYFKNDFAYLVKDEFDNILGFVLIDNNGNFNYEISEMFILNNYKRKKIGEVVTNKVFDMHKGNWTIKSVPLSPIAESFWLKIINNYTNGKYTLEYIGKYNRAVFHFKNY